MAGRPAHLRHGHNGAARDALPAPAGLAARTTAPTTTVDTAASRCYAAPAAWPPCLPPALPVGPCSARAARFAGLALFADLHVHPILFGFNRLRNTAAEGDDAAFHAWNVPPSDLGRQSAGARATLYSQGDFAKLHRSGTRLVCASLTPIETGFLDGTPRDAARRPFAAEALKLATGVTVARSAVHVVRRDGHVALRELTAIFRNRGPARQLLQVGYLRYPAARIRHMLSRAYDYWDELQREYAFLLARDGVATPAGRYDLVRDAAHLAATLGEADGRIAVVLTIEGGHVFSMGTDHTRQPNAVIFERIDTLKRWPHPILFLTAAHHFDNGFCGHARSLVDRAGLVMDQTPRMEAGFEEERDLGRRVFRALLDLDDTLRDLGGRRILIDCKHLSPRVRKAYYDEIVRPYNARADRTRPPIPVVHSHAGYAGVATLDALIRDAHKQTDDWLVDGFYGWGLNLCDEDVHAVHETNGLIGVCFDKRVAGVAPGAKVPAELQARVLVRQVLAMVDVIMRDDTIGEARKAAVWDCVCIGSDFDGAIHPFAEVATALQLPAFAEALRAVLLEQRHTRMIDRLGVDTLVDKVCWKNVAAFVERHLPFA